MLDAHLYADPPPLSIFVPTVPPVLEQVVMRLLAKDPEERYPSAEAVINVLDGLRAGLESSDLSAPVTPFVGRGTERTQAPSSPRILSVPLAGERRVITAIAAQVEGATGLVEQIDVEAWVEIVNRVFQILGAEIYRYGGEIDQYRGDEVVAVFGATAAHEDDPERAVLGALAMQEAIDQYATVLAEQEGIELLLRVGVNTGEVIVASVSDSRQHSEDTAMGRGIALAQRMAIAAESGTVLVSENTYRLIKPLFEWKPLGEIAVKGVSQPVTVYRPLAHKALPSKGRGIVGLESPLVGRDAELRALGEAIERLQSGIGGIVTLVGEAGLGKSRLVAECRGTVTQRSWTQAAAPLQWIEGRCLSYGTTTAYQLWLNGLRALLGVTLDDLPAAIVDALWKRVRTLCPDNADDVFPYLGRMMSLPLEHEVEARLLGLGAQGLRVCTFRAMETLLESAAQQHPLIVVCEDLHWADPTSIDLLEQMLALTDRAPLLFICVLRPETEHACWRIKDAAVHLYRHRHTDLWLESLSVAESAELVGNLLRIEDLSPKLKERILSHAEGNPFYVEEILRSLIDGGVVAHDEATGRWQATEDLDEIAIPDTLHGVLMARIDRLRTDTKYVLQLASVIGRVFPYRVLAGIVSEEAELDVHLLVLQRRQLIREQTRVPELEYIFEHHLTQEAVYNSLLKKDRQVFHRRVAEAYEQLFVDRLDEQLGLLAHHWHQTGDVDRERLYAGLAGRWAAAQFANVEAASYFGRALELTPETDLAARYDLLLAREAVNDLRGERAVQAEDLSALTALVGAVEDPQQATCWGATVLLRQANYFEETSDYASALEAVQTAIGLLVQVQDPENETAGYIAWGKVLWRQGDYQQAHAPLERALELARETHNRQAEARSLYYLGDVHTYQRYFTDAQRCYQQSLEIHRANSNRPEEADCLSSLGVICGELADWPRARDYFEQALTILQTIGDRRGQTMTLSNLGVIYCDLGDYPAARDYHEQALHIRRAMGDRWGEAVSLVNLGLVYHYLDENQTARQDCEQALAIQREIGDRRGQGYSLTYLGHALAALDDPQAAGEAYTKAMHLRHELGQHGPAIDDLAGLARADIALGDSEQALERVQAILSWIEDNGAEGIEYPLQVYLTCYRILRETPDPDPVAIERADALLSLAHTSLMERAAAIGDETLRHKLLTNVKTHREILSLWETH